MVEGDPESGKANGPQAVAYGPFGGLFEIYQEVVTLSIPTRGLSTMATSANSGS